MGGIDPSAQDSRRPSGAGESRCYRNALLVRCKRGWLQPVLPDRKPDPLPFTRSYAATLFLEELRLFRLAGDALKAVVDFESQHR